MKLTKSKLKRIILEETQIVLTELSMPPAADLAEPLVKKWGAKAAKEPATAMKVFQNGLDVAGIVGDMVVPGGGAPFDAINTAIYLKRGDHLMAGLSALSMVPILGDVVGKGGKLAMLGSEAAKIAERGKRARIRSGVLQPIIKQAVPIAIDNWRPVEKKFGNEKAAQMLAALKNLHGGYGGKDVPEAPPETAPEETSEEA